MNGEGDAPEFPSELPVPDTKEIETITQHFKDRFNEEADFYVKVPGRVNLIGEHVDYCGFSVCPMAIQQHILVAVKKSNNGVLEITNLEEKYEDYNCDVSDISIDVQGAPKWYQYFLCGVKGIQDKEEAAKTQGFKAAVTGNIPPSSGLSSSSALVSAAVLATAKVNDVQFPKNQLAEIAASCERYIGTQGGGMDQAIAFLATQGCAKLISFNPLKSENIQLPDGAIFVIANSLAEMNKAATGDFNCRVVECRLACQVFARRLNLDWKRTKRLGDLQEKIGLGVRHFRALAMETLHEKPYTKKEICNELWIKEEDLDKMSLTENTKDIKEFKLRQRVLHVFEEVARVQDFVITCQNAANGKIQSNEALWKLGDLMKQSHNSLKTLYECSHDELDKITEIAQKSRALGARLTGAGWGGCTVALTTKETVNEYISNLKQEFYTNNPAASGKDFDTLVFATQPGGGTEIYVKS